MVLMFALGLGLCFLGNLGFSLNLCLKVLGVLGRVYVSVCV